MQRASRTIPLSLLFAVVVSPGCIGALVVEEILGQSRERDGFVRVAETEHLVAYAPPQSEPAREAAADLAFLEDVLRHYEWLLGDLPAQKLAMYLHTSSVDNEFLSADGVAHPDGTTDIQWYSWAAVRRQLEAHEMAHLVLADVIGSNPRPFLEEGMAEHLSETYPGSYADEEGLAPPPSLSNFAFAGYPCAREWSLADLLAGARFLRGNDNLGRGYEPAALFTEIAVQRLGISEYIDCLYHPAGRGTAADVERLLLAALGVDLVSMETSMRRAGNIYPSSCSRANPCPGLCTCTSESGNPRGECWP